MEPSVYTDFETYIFQLSIDGIKYSNFTFIRINYNAEKKVIYIVNFDKKSLFGKNTG